MNNKKLVSYSPELYYFFNSKEFKEKNYQKSVFVIAKTVGQWCDYYSAKLLSPLKGLKDIKKEGKLPTNKKEREIFIQNLVEWIFDKNYMEDLFLLFLGDKSMLTDRLVSLKFDYHDDTCCWVLNLTEKEFKQLQNNLKKNNLPEDLFYESSKGKCIPNKPKTLAGRFFKILGFESSKCYTPKQWEIEKNKTNINKSQP